MSDQSITIALPEPDVRAERVREFRDSLAARDVDAVIDQWLLRDEAIHVSTEDMEFLKDTLSKAFNVPADGISLWITGSAKLGFSMTPKRRDGVFFPRYRSFSEISDIDVAVVAPEIFDLVWGDLSAYSHRAAHFPWASGRLGDYMTVGWLRPDKFPKNVRLRHCDAWWDTFRKLSRSPRFKRRTVRGGLFHSVDHLRRYMGRAVNDCILAEDM